MRTSLLTRINTFIAKAMSEDDTKYGQWRSQEGAQGAQAPPFALVRVCREWQWSAGSDCVALLPGRQDRWYSSALRVQVRQTKATPPTHVRAYSTSAAPSRNPGYAPDGILFQSELYNTRDSVV